MIFILRHPSSRFSGSERAMKRTYREDLRAVSRDYVVALLRMAESHGIAKKNMLRGTGISDRELSDRDTYVTVRQYRRLFHNASKELRDPAFGLRFGQQQHVAVHGALGFAVVNSADLEQAARVTCKYIKTRNRLVSLTLVKEDRSAVLDMEVSLPQEDELYRFLVEQSLSAFALILTSLLGTVDYAVTFKYPEPDYGDVYLDIFKQRVSFDAEANQMRLPLDLLRRPVALSNPALIRIAEKQCEILLAKQEEEENLPQQIQALLIEIPGHLPSQEEVASRLGISKRTLVRRLHRMGMSYVEVVKSVRQELALHYLITTNWSMEEISSMLGYESPSNFGRAFKTWTGESPGAYRIRNS